MVTSRAMLDVSLLAAGKPRRIKREECQALVRQGFFGEQRVELLDLTRGDSQPVPDLAIVPLGTYDRRHQDRALFE